MAGNCAFPEMFSKEAIIRNNCVHLEIFFCHLGVKKEFFAFMGKKRKKKKALFIKKDIQYPEV